MYDQVCETARIFKEVETKIFHEQREFEFINSASIFKGFFFLFVYKDFFIREIVEFAEGELSQEKHVEMLAVVRTEFQ